MPRIEDDQIKGQLQTLFNQLGANVEFHKGETVDVIEAPFELLKTVIL